MQTAVIPSTLLLTLLMCVGLFFFIRASVKDRTEEVTWPVDWPEETLRDRLRTYFANRAYRVAAIDADRDAVTFEGFVRPSLGLAAFLSTLAAVGLTCLAAIPMMVVPGLGPLPLALVLLAPVAGWFYWKNAGRIEQVCIRLDDPAESDGAAGAETEGDWTEGDRAGKDDNTRHLTAIAHRDELAAMERALSLRRI